MSDTNEPHPTLQQALLCDDVRVENTGKGILIGVYNKDILIPALPATVNLCLWMRYTLPEARKTYSLEFSVFGERNQPLMRPLQMNLETTDTSQYADIAVRGIVLNITEFQALSFQWREAGSEFQQALSIKVGQLPGIIEQSFMATASGSHV